MATPSPGVFDRLDWPVHTDRLTLRPARAADADAVWQYRRLESVAQWITELPADPGAFRARFTAPGRLATSLMVERDGSIIGDLMVRVEDGWAQTEVADTARAVHAELGWVFDPTHHGDGYATEAVRELLRLCFTELGLRRITALCFADNEPSWRLMERIGLRRESHTVRDSLHRSGRWLDSLGYALLAEEWNTRA
ncbi:N-acetyltransferase [Jiangella asiatica]|uniref:N-acetyltransferase n=2 Tax=Jiangella asiatica TaxID=2530372 RepID=A0A4R5DKS4_9ACTN|nr:N-acetyltransferase [Jiangella asiatica]